MKVEVALLGSPSLIVHTVSVGVKQHSATRIRAQELCESRGDRPGFLVPNKLHVFCGRKATLDQSGAAEE